MIEEIREFNKSFVKDEKYQSYITSKYPDKKLAILTCMDTRLTELLPAALGAEKRRCEADKKRGRRYFQSLWQCGEKSSHRGL